MKLKPTVNIPNPREINAKTIQGIIRRTLLTLGLIEKAKRFDSAACVVINGSRTIFDANKPMIALATKFVQIRV